MDFGDNMGAIICYDMAIKLNPDFSLAYINKAYCLAKIGDNKISTECIKKAI